MQKRRDGGAEGGMLVGRERGDLATGGEDGGARVAVFLDGEIALELDGALDRAGPLPLIFTKSAELDFRQIKRNPVNPTRAFY